MPGRALTLFILISALATIAFAQAAAPPKVNARPSPTPSAPAAEPFDKADVKTMSGQCVSLDTDAGVIELELYPEHAPESVRNFLNLTATGLFDGTSFSRVVPGFVIQGGFMPTRREPPDEKQETYIRTLQPEFNDTPHDRGTLSMARGDDPASATSSFFIVLARTPALDGKYTAFGRVVDGISVVEAIEQAPLNGEEPVTRIELKQVRIVK